MLFKSVVNSLAVACLAAGVLSQPIAHLHHAHKRDVVHVTQTVVITVGAGATDVPSAPAAIQQTISEEQTSGTATDYAYSIAAATNTPNAATTSSASNVAPAAAVNVETSSSSTAAATSTSSSESSSDDSSSFSALSKGITYSPYNSDGTCKDLASVKSDLAKLSDYSLIRLYGVDCNQVENVLQAKGSSQKLFLGIFYVNDISGGISEIANAISSYGSWADVHTVSIGNELVNNGEATVSQVASYVDTARSALTSAGYSGPVVSVDTHVAILNNPELCQYSDYIAFNAHAYWDGTIQGSDAGPWLLLQMQRVWSACGGKTVMCVESGWPHQGGNNGVAVASSSEQSSAISSIQSTCGADTVVFNAFDDLWKNPGSNGVEQYWGIY